MALITVSAPTQPSSSPADAAEKLHHNPKGSGFINPWASFRAPSQAAILKWVWYSQIPGRRQEVELQPGTLPVRKPNFLPSRASGITCLRSTWLGHACCYVEFPSGLRVLFDPVFTQRCSPLSFMGPSRYTKMPCSIEDIPFVDAVIISHNHYDHLSHPTLEAIAARHKHAQIFVPLGNAAWFAKCGFRNVTELDWWEQRELTITFPATDEAVTPTKATISCLPCQHTSGRGLFDRAHTLWASWAVSSGGKNVWFGGDTGYRTVPSLPHDEFDYDEKHASLPHCPAFQQIGELRGRFDLGLIPIGAYDPRTLMSPVHCNPYDSVNIFQDIKCKKAMAIHWGTWVLTDEPVLEPPHKLKEALKWKGLPEHGLFDVCDIGESREF